jgi:hypothetical protein
MEVVLNSIFLWFIQFTLAKKYGIPSSYASKLVSSTNATAVALTSFLYLLKYVPISYFHNVCQVFIGYLIYDTIIQFGDDYLYKNLNKGILLHHAIVGLSIYRYSSLYPELFALSLLSELVNPFMYYAMYIRSVSTFDNRMYGRSSGKQSRIFGYITLVLYAIFRVTNFTCILVHLIRNRIYHPSVPLFVITVLNYYWWGKLYQKFYDTTKVYEYVVGSIEPPVSMPVTFEVKAQDCMEAGKLIFSEMMQYIAKENPSPQNYNFGVRNMSTKEYHVISAEYHNSY